MLNIQNLSYLQGGIPLLQNVNLQAYANQRIGLVGKNGCGKSTLFRLIRGEIRPDSGEVALQSGKTIAFVEQEIASSDQPALEFVLDGDVELRLLEKNPGEGKSRCGMVRCATPLRGHRRLRCQGARRTAAERAGLCQRHAGAPGHQFLRRLAHAPESGARADA